MNDQWLKNGKRWNSAEKARVARRFRHHVRTPSNPRGRIHREGCFWHPDVEAEAHHPDYAQTFVVVWVGVVCGCHRKVERGAMRIPQKAIHDYTSLIAHIALPGARRTGPVESYACTCGRRRKGEPHRGGCPRDGEETPF